MRGWRPQHTFARVTKEAMKHHIAPRDLHTIVRYPQSLRFIEGYSYSVLQTVTAVPFPQSYGKNKRRKFFPSPFTYLALFNYGK